MDTIKKATIDAYMKGLYDGKPEGDLLKSVQEYEQKLIDYVEAHPNSADFLNESGLQGEYTQLYMAVINRNNDYSTTPEEEAPKAFDYEQEQKIPTVHEFLDSYRMVWEQSIKPNNRPLTDEAYQKLFDVENRTDDIIEAQIIIEREHLIVNTVTADYKYIAQDFLEAVDPNYEVTSATVNATIGVYANAKNLDEITYMSEVAKAKCDDIAVQLQLKVQLFVNLVALIFGWENSKMKIRGGSPEIDKFAKAMVVTRQKVRNYVRFMSEDMGIDFDKIEKTPFYRISLLNPTALDELWRIKKVQHPSNFDAIKYVLFEEILTDKTIEEILMTPQKVPYYFPIDTNLYEQNLDEEYLKVAEDLNKDIKFFQRNRRPGEPMSEEKGEDKKAMRLTPGGLINKTRAFSIQLSAAANGMSDIGRGGGIGGGLGATNQTMGAAGGIKGAFSGVSIGMKSMSKDQKKEMGKSTAKGVASTAAKEVGRGLLRGLFKK